MAKAAHEEKHEGTRRGPQMTPMAADEEHGYEDTKWGYEEKKRG